LKKEYLFSFKKEKLLMTIIQKFWPRNENSREKRGNPNETRGERETISGE